MISIKTALHNSKAMALTHLAGIIVIAIWGASFISSDALLKEGMGPIEIYVYRFVVAYILMVFISHKKWMANSWQDEGLFLLCGLLAGSVYYVAENVALMYTSTTNVSLLTSTSPLFTAMIVGLLYKSERPNGGAMLGSAIAFLGVGCVIFNSAFLENGTGFKVGPIGDLLSLAAAMSWAIYSVILRRLNVLYDSFFITRKTFFYGLLTSIPIWLATGPVHNPIDMLTNKVVLLNVGFLGVGASLVAFIMWANVVKRMGAVNANNYLYLQPIFTLILSLMLIPNEHITIVGITGIVLILGGLWLGDKLSHNWRKVPK